MPSKLEWICHTYSQKLRAGGGEEVVKSELLISLAWILISFIWRIVCKEIYMNRSENKQQKKEKDNYFHCVSIHQIHAHTSAIHDRVSFVKYLAIIMPK